MADSGIARQISSRWSNITSGWRDSWLATPPWFRALWVLIVAISLAGALQLVTQIGGADFSFRLSVWTYAIAPAGSGLLVILASRLRRDAGSRAWLMIGLGVFFWGIGELIWVAYSGMLNVEVPYPGWADVFYVGAYPFIFVGVLMLPHMHTRKWERVRLSLDALAGTVAVAAIMWTFYLKDAIYLDSEAGLLENSINLAYPVGDLILLVGLVVLATRRSKYQFDGRLLLLALATLLTTVADIAYVLQLEDGSYVDGGRLDALWLLDYGLYAVAALLVAGPPRFRAQADRPSRFLAMIAPYSAVVLLFVLTLSESSTVLQAATALVGLLIILRQGVAIRETREVIEKQRNDLVASISHELRTPLAAMAGFTEIVLEDQEMDKTERAELLSIVKDQTNHLSRIVGDLVEVARDNLAATDLTYSTIDATTLVESAVDIAGTDSPRSSMAATLPPDLAITGDTDRLRQVLVNFLTNAARYGGGSVEVRAARNLRGEVTIEVHDDGPGIPKKYELTIWDRFDRGPQTYMSAAQGSGLGLSIARQLVAAHGGQTGHRRSELLGGACFWFRLPREAEQPITHSEQHPAA